jgi:hypothetical protein
MSISIGFFSLISGLASNHVHGLNTYSVHRVNVKIIFRQTPFPRENRTFPGAEVLNYPIIIFRIYESPEPVI